MRRSHYILLTVLEQNVQTRVTSNSERFTFLCLPGTRIKYLATIIIFYTNSLFPPNKYRHTQSTICIDTIFWRKFVISIFINIISSYCDIDPIQKWTISLNFLLICINQPLKDLTKGKVVKAIRNNRLAVIRINNLKTKLLNVLTLYLYNF